MWNKPISPSVWCNEVLKCLSTKHSNLKAGGLCPLQSPGTLLAWPDCENKLQMTKRNCNFKSRNQTRHNKPQSSRLTCHNSCVWNSTVKAFRVLTFPPSGHSVCNVRLGKAADKPLLITSWHVVAFIKKIFIPSPKQPCLCHPTLKQGRRVPLFLNTQVITICALLTALYEHQASSSFFFSFFLPVLHYSPFWWPT